MCRCFSSWYELFYLVSSMSAQGLGGIENWDVMQGKVKGLSIAEGDSNWTADPLWCIPNSGASLKCQNRLPYQLAKDLLTFQADTGRSGKNRVCTFRQIVSPTSRSPPWSMSVAFTCHNQFGLSDREVFKHQLLHKLLFSFRGQIICNVQLFLEYLSRFRNHKQTGELNYFPVVSFFQNNSQHQGKCRAVCNSVRGNIFN